MGTAIDHESHSESSGHHMTQVYRPDVDISGVDEKKLMRRVDWHVIPWLALLYLLNFLDRGSIGNAKLYHMEKDLGINDNQYLIALTLFFFPYSLFEPASNVFLRRLKPSIWLSTMMVLWGIVMTLHGVIHDYGGLITLRLLLGLAEAGMYPGIVFYISSWYKRSETGTKVAIFFSSATVAGAFSGLLAAAIANMDGIGGKPGWAWIFILEGLATVIIGVISYFIIQDFPDTAKFLSEEERVFIIRRLQSDNKFSAAGEKFHAKYVWSSLKDWKTWAARFTATKANLLSVPVYAWGCLMTLVFGVFADRLNKRCLVNVCLFGVGLVGYIILICSRTPALSYFAVYLAISAIYPTIPNSVAWVAGNVEGSYKRSVTLGMAIGFGNLNGAVTSNIVSSTLDLSGNALIISATQYRAKDQPWYRLGHGIVLAYIGIGFFSSIIYAYFLHRENLKRERGERDEVIDGIDNKNAREYNGRYESIEAAKIDKGDEWSGFRYST
ncbi:hypothetical protein NP233_g7613 [Leucocoprinus birnbaumii]|uniref:Major facilitator superfamily (MFS) profile domain-containing protein n=1 Tax=Leucocoprinus birnbaumii TaxID=56174 RepID=A0AAD5VQF9_9AGAR|nr:hypothetical protein NP233_g7613 [Leucocoprinus birnbaumii]